MSSLDDNEYELRKDEVITNEQMDELAQCGRTHCPICGYDKEEEFRKKLKAVIRCHNCGYQILFDELIDGNSDYAWVQ